MSYDFESFITVGTKLPRHIARVIEGDHGIGKSQGVKQISNNLDLPMLDIRLALMTEGDFIGIPEIIDVQFNDPKVEAEYQADLESTLAGMSSGAAEQVAKGIRAKWDRKTTTRFAPPEFIIKCAQTPHVLLLDEFNRATPEVKQAAFQLILDRNVNGHYLHPQTIVFAAMNTASQYHVDSLDPALYDRFAVIKLQPTIDDWLSWARGSLCDEIVDFISQWPSHLEHHGDIEPYKVYPSRRSWARLDESFVDVKLADVASNNVVHHLVQLTAQSIVGIEAAVAFTNFVKSCKQNVTADDVINKFGKVERRIDFNDYGYLNALIDRLDIHCGENSWTDRQIKNIAAFQRKLPAEMVIASWRKFVTSNSENAKNVHYLNKEFVLECIGEVRDDL